MIDITKCTDSKCPSRRSCYRYMSKAGTRQSYAQFDRVEGDEACEHFEPIRKTDEINKEKQ
jgi:hypothetical protein